MAGICIASDDIGLQGMQYLVGANLTNLRVLDLSAHVKGLDLNAIKLISSANWPLLRH